MTTPAVTDMGTPTATPPTVRGAVVLLSAQAVAAAAITLFLVYEDLTVGGASQRLAWAVTGTAVVIGALLVLLARSVARYRRWARDIAVALNLTFLAPAYYMIVGELAWLGVIVGLICLATIAMLVAPPTNRAVGEAGFSL
ncbi:hypothetical protein AB0M47_27625 [Hamadaea sp. NPDC051192]|uniref:hypothetical protein n=1 Tax=Hamadaea sp. NPDC051192 TaxID=3154940 RepID=UPI00342FF776